MTLQPRELGANAWADRGGIAELSIRNPNPHPQISPLGINEASNYPSLAVPRHEPIILEQ